jgi:hypothetical protein
MANTLHDRNVDPQGDPVRMITVLINAGFSSNDIIANWDGVLTMAMIRQRNEERR